MIHQILGNESNLPKLNQHFSLLKNQISITFNTNKILKPLIDAITVPHAGFVYSGILGLFAISEILEANKTAKTITILWFRHNKEKKEEHSMINVEKLVKLLNPTIEIKNIEITKSTILSDLENLKPPFLVSTDFAHYNYGTSAQNLMEAWENDKPFLKMINKNTLSLLNSNKKYPCGYEGLKIMKEWTSTKKGNVLQLFGYSNSKYKEKWWLKDNTPFNGMTYASLGSIKKSHNWFSSLNSKMLAYSHLGWVKDCLLSSNNTFADNNGLFWSRLNNMVGSCFLTVYRENKDTYSCFGSWEEQLSSLLDNIINATKTVKRVSWGANKPVNKQVLNIDLKGKYSLSLSLIEPRKKWKLVLDINNPRIKTNRGYVYCHRKTKKIGMTFLPSVWDNISTKKDFFEKLKQKHEGNYPKNPNNPNEWELYCYESISWNLQL